MKKATKKDVHQDMLGPLWRGRPFWKCNLQGISDTWGRKNSEIIQFRTVAWPFITLALSLTQDTSTCQAFLFQIWSSCTLCSSRELVGEKMTFFLFSYPVINSGNCGLLSSCWIIKNYPAQSCEYSWFSVSKLCLRPRALNVTRYSVRFCRRIIVKGARSRI